MARQTHKGLEALARDIAHRGDALSDFERALFWTRLLQLAEPARALAVMEASAHAGDRAHRRRAAESGTARARLAATVDLAILSETSPNPDLSDSTFASRLFVWHDWASFEMDLADWLAALPEKELERELAERVRSGLPPSTAGSVTRRVRRP